MELAEMDEDGQAEQDGQVVEVSGDGRLTRLEASVMYTQEKGASSWLTTLPISEHGFALHKGAFCDALALRYGWDPPNTPSHCICGKSFTVEHALSCPFGGFPTLRHNEIRNLTAV